MNAPVSLAHEAQRRAVRACVAEAGQGLDARISALTALTNTLNAELVGLNVPLAARLEIIARTLALNADVSAGDHDGLASSLFDNTVLLARQHLAFLRSFRRATAAEEAARSHKGETL